MINWNDEMDAATERDDRLVSERDGQISGRASGIVASSVERSLHEQGITAAAVRRGSTPEAIMEEDYRGLAHAHYPTPECLTPDELEILYLRDPVGPPAWTNARLQHVKGCPACRMLFASIHPDAESRKKFERAMEESFAARAAAAGGTGTKLLIKKLQQAAAAAVDYVRAGSRR